MPKKILYFFPLNPSDNNTGSCRRALGLLQYCKAKAYEVVFVSQQDWGQWTPETEKAFLQLNLAKSLYVLARKPVKKNPVRYYFTYKIWHQRYDYTLKKSNQGLPNHTSLHLLNQFNQILTAHRFDIIIISYAYWAHLIANNPLTKGIHCILDTHDWLTAQHLHDKSTLRSRLFDDEMTRLSFFQSIWAISPEEQYLFAQMTGKPVNYVPAWIDDPLHEGMQEPDVKLFDLIYVATDNPHNQRSIQWFLQEVLPLLPQGIRLLCIGTINKYIPDHDPGITKMNYVPDLTKAYLQSRVAICPMRSGTGVKIKVIEAMAHGLPIVGQTRALDGMPIRIENGCLVAETPEAFARHILALLQDANYYALQASNARKCYLSCFTQAIGYAHVDEALPPH